TLIYNQQKNEFIVRKGPIFTNFVLADEINRAPAKVQSALLEAMQERQVTIGDTTYKLDDPFLVLATQNPLEQEGTYPLPEAQVDRFIMKVVVGYPKMHEEQLIIRQNVQGLKTEPVKQVVSIQEVKNAKELTRQIYMDEKIEQYILDIVFATRTPEKYQLEKLKPLISYGGSPRASINLALAGKAQAFLNKRGFVIPEDIRSICNDVLRHRIGLTYEAEAENVKVEDVVEEILKKVNVP
ncbi:MAG: MoxR family ATPase, partial [Chitinophagaceae bacterium]|nr:MoxR family ATPase [Chitinophagaceae bacterium]